METTTVAELNNRDDLILASDSQDVQYVKEYLGEIAQDYDSFFLKVEDGDYAEVWGMEGIIPYLYKTVHKIV
jgi:hypothetical protein